MSFDHKPILFTSILTDQDSHEDCKTKWSDESGVPKDLGDHRRWFAQIPRCIYYMDGLSKDAILLYTWYFQVAGDLGTCWQTVKTLTKFTKISDKTIKKARMLLVKYGLVTVEVRMVKGSERHYVKINPNIWKINKEFFTEIFQTSSSKTPSEIYDDPVVNLRRNNTTVNKSNASSLSSYKDKELRIVASTDGDLSRQKDNTRNSPTTSSNNKSNSPPKKGTFNFRSKSKDQTYASKAADRLHEKLARHRRLDRAYYNHVWEKDISKFMTDTETTEEEFEDVLSWFIAADIEDQYMPLVKSAKTFCGKFVNIRLQKVRNSDVQDQEDIGSRVLELLESRKLFSNDRLFAH